MTDKALLIDHFTAAWNARDVDAVMALMADDCEFRTSVGPGPGAAYVGHDEVRRAVKAFLDGPSDPYVESGPVIAHVSEEFAVTRWTTCTSRPGEDPVLVSACDVFVFSGDLIQTKDTYRKAVGPAPC